MIKLAYKPVSLLVRVLRGVQAKAA